MGAHHFYYSNRKTPTAIQFGPALIGMTILMCFVYVIMWAQTLIAHGPARNLRA